MERRWLAFPEYLLLGPEQRSSLAAGRPAWPSGSQSAYERGFVLFLNDMGEARHSKLVFVPHALGSSAVGDLIEAVNRVFSR